MKDNPLGAVLVGVLLLGAFLALWLATGFYFSVKELERVNGQYVTLTRTLNTVQALANEAVEYSKRNPAIDPILQQYELKPRTAATPAPKPAAK